MLAITASAMGFLLIEATQRPAVAAVAALLAGALAFWTMVRLWHAVGRRAPTSWRHRIVNWRPVDGGLVVEGPWHRARLACRAPDVQGTAVLLDAGPPAVRIECGPGLRGHHRATSTAQAIRHG